MRYTFNKIFSLRMLYLLGALFSLASEQLVYAAAPTAGGSVLEEPKIVAVGAEGEIHINFSTEIRYIKHFPESQGDVLRVYVEVVDPCEAVEIVSQESRWLPPADWYIPFTITFPEIIKRSGSGTAFCPATQTRVDVAQAVLVKFRKITNFKVRRGDDNHSLVVVIPLLKQPNENLARAEVKAAETKAPESPKPQIIPVEKVAAADKAATVKEPQPEAQPQKANEPAVEPAAPVEPVAKSEPVAQPEPVAKPEPVAQPEKIAKAEQVIQPPEPQAETTASPAQAPIPSVPASELIVTARAALAAGDAIKATQTLNQLLDLPPNDFSQEAQELVGVAREKSGEIEKAIVEYKLYLQLYPDGEGAKRVRESLAGLETVAKPTTKVAERPKKAKREINQNTFTGGISQYYYSGYSQNKVNPATGADTDTSTHDQSMLITNVDGTGRFRRNEYETKIVFRNTETHNLLTQVDIADKNTVSAAYLEFANKDVDYMFRVGRQSGTAQGVMGRFDGAFGRVAINPKWHIAAVVGQPDDGTHNKVQTNRHFYGAAVEFGPLAEKWSGSVYAIQQVADGMAERRAIGSELRYFNGTTSWFGMMDYDTIYNMVNVAMLQGNWVAFDGYNFNFLLDHRKSPMMYAETAIPAKTNALSVGDLRTTLSNSDIHDYVKGLVPDSDMAMLGITKQVTERWQVGGDVRFNRTYNTDGAGVVPGQPGSGNVYAYTVQAIGTNTLFKGDTSVIMASYVNDPHYNAQNLSYSNSLPLGEKLRLDSSLRYYHEKQSTDTRTWKVTPTIRLNYRWRDNMSFEMEATVDRTHTDDPVSSQITDNWRETIFAGYRWDFR